MSTARIDPDRLWASLEEISAIGAVPDAPAGPGLHRLAGSPQDGAARGYVVDAARAAGCRLRVDPVGNVFLRRPGVDEAAAAVLMGSHLDSQPAAGRYDRTYGVMAGLEVLRALDGADSLTQRPVELVIWTNEEGARFAPAMMGSSVFGGRLTAARALASMDAHGVTLAQALADRVPGHGSGPRRRRHHLRRPAGWVPRLRGSTHRTGAAPGGPRRADRRGHGRTGPVLDRRPADRRPRTCGDLPDGAAT